MSKEIVVFDTEILPSHFLFCAKRLSDGKVIRLWGHNPEDMERLGLLIRNPNITWVSFNGIKFDMILIAAAIGGATVRELKALANDLINNSKPEWMALRDHALERPKCADGTPIDHIDLMEVAPGVMVSLKLYGSRMGSRSLVDMPFHHDDFLEDWQAEVLAEYCENDLEETTSLYRRLEQQIALRAEVGEKYGLDLRSKSDAQMAEAIIAKELKIGRVGATPVPSTVTYKAPPFIQPQGMVLQDILARVQKHQFKVNQANGSVDLPDFLKDEPVLIGKGIYQMGIGGLHSQHDRCVLWEATPEFEIVDADVGSYYPNLILNANLVPRGLGVPFIRLYRNIVTDRLAAKKRGDMVLANTYKIVANGTFGKLGSMFSKLYAPDLMLATTLTGQFYLLTLIEELNDMGVTVISANTDGVTFGGHPDLIKKAIALIEVYGWTTNFEFEFVRYSRIAYKDCNNYLAVKVGGGVKSKGIYADSGLMKNPTNEVCTLAAQAHLATGRSVRSFIHEHLRIENFPDFLQARTVNGGAMQCTAVALPADMPEFLRSYGYVQEGKKWRLGDWLDTELMTGRRQIELLIRANGVKLGRVARWYYSTDPQYSEGIRYVKSGNLVPKSEGGRACMKMPDTLPTDIDVDRYIAETISHLHNMGLPYVLQ
jgi:hypothetical protein